MEFSASMVASIIALLGLASLGAVVAKLRREQAELRQHGQRLARQMEELSQELGGLCAAGVQRDRATIDQDQRLRECLERVESLLVDEPGGYPYHGAIEMIRKGATAQDVAGEVGITLAEAELLVRLHRG